EVSGTTIPMIKVSDINDIRIPIINLDKQKNIAKYLKLAYQGNELLRNLIDQKQKYSKEIFETLVLQGE
ncbi:TPA: restriction endonuclease subunit S, partial [Campylobacter fetus]|nr:restriction endonuclease subunit S [Campylobacter fetus]